MKLPDVQDPTFWQNSPDSALAELASRCPVAHHPAADLWTVSSHRDIIEISKDPTTYSSARGVLINDRNRTVAATDSLLYNDPPNHAAQRRVVNRAFTARKILGLTDVIEEIVTDVLDRLDDSTAIDAVDALSAPIPILVIAHMLGVPSDDLPTFRAWSDAIAVAATDPTDPRAMQAIDFFAYFDAKLNERDKDPVDDLLSALVTDSDLTRAEQLGFCMTLLVAGNETTRHLISGGLLALANNPDQRALLVSEPERMGDAVEEMLRWVTPIVAMARTTVEPTHIGGEAVPDSSFLVMLYAAANRDPDVFGSTAQQFDITRSPNPHLAFGIGEHYCLGAQLARLEARTVFNEILRRWPHFKVLGAEMGASTLLRECARLPILLRPENA